MLPRDPLYRMPPPHYPRTFSKKFAPEVVLSRQVPVHPARFVVGMDEEKRPLYPEGLQPPKVEGTAIACASYVARVDQVTERGEVSVTLWERPNGREGLTTLLVDTHLGGKRPLAGDLLWIWTWVDVVDHDGESREVPKIHVDIETRELTDEDRNHLRDLVAQLRGNDG